MADGSAQPSDRNAGDASKGDVEKITLFAPFEDKGTGRGLSLFQKSSELESDPATGSSKEIEFQDSDSQATGNAKVLFRKLKAVVSSGGSSSSSYSPSSTPSPAQLAIANKNKSSKQPTFKLHVNVVSPEEGEGKGKYEKHGSSTSISSSMVVSSSGGQVVSLKGSERGPIADDSRISLTSYSDAHRRAAAAKEEQVGLDVPDGRPQRGGGGGGGGREGGKGVGGGGNTGAVNKTEVLKRFGTIAIMQDTNTDIKRYWMPDKVCKECSNCSVKFGMFVRRHHCRICGRIFCHACCSITIPGEALRPDLQGNLRTCKACYEVFNEYRQSKAAEKAAQPSDSVPIDHIPSSSLSSKLGGESPQPLHGSGNFGRTLTGPRPSMHKSWDEASSVGRSQEGVDMSPSRTATIEFDNPTPTRRRLTGRRPTDFDAIGAKRDSVIILDEDEVGCIASAIWSKFLDPTTGLSRSSHRHRLRTFPDSYTGVDIVTWLLSNGCVASRQAGVQVGQSLVDTKRLKIISSIDSEFRDEMNQFLELGEAAHLSMEDGSSPIFRDAPKWFQRIPQESDSEHEGSRYSLNETYPAAQGARVRIGPIPSSGGIYDHSVTLSSISKLTGSQESMHQQKPSTDDYLVVDEELMSKSHESSMPSSRHSSPSPLVIQQQLQPEHTSPAEKSPSTSAAGVKFSVSPSKSTESQTVGSEVSASSSRNSRNSLTIVSMQHGTPHILEADAVSDDEFADDQEEWYRPKSTEEASLVFQSMYNTHFDVLMTQIIKSYGLSLSWLDILRPLIIEATQVVRTDIYPEDSMDINEYIRVKKIPCGERIDSSFTYGVVCSKNVTHKKMKCEISKPTILLLKCSFDFMRHENLLSMFDTLRTQELDFLKHLVDQIKVINPSIMLVQKSVSRWALEKLFSMGVVVAVNVKPSVMRRVARCTGAEIMTSLTQLSYNVRLGTCGKFYLRNFTLESGDKKTLMYFDDCEPRLGCVITLQGGTNRELKKVKRVTQFGLHLAHNSILESTFLLDEYAWPRKGTDDGLNDDELMVDDYKSSSSTPEVPLHPSLAHPLESLPPANIVRRLTYLGLCGPEDKTDKIKDDENEEYGEEFEEDSTHLKSLETGVNELESRESVFAKQQEKQLTRSSENISLENKNLNSVARVTTDSSLELQSSVEGSGSPPPYSLHARENGRKTVSPENPLSTCPEEILVSLGEIEFEAAMKRQLISVSPRVKYNVPYLQTAAGRQADIRKYLPNVIFWSVQFAPKPRRVFLPEIPFKGENFAESSEEVGLTMSVEVGTEDSEPGIKTVEPRMRSQTSTQTIHLPSYKSVSEHPLTRSFLLLRANTNEMQAALADFRSRAGLVEEENDFFFKSARQATNYRVLLQNVFNKYKQFEIELEEEEEEEAGAMEDEEKKKTMKKKKRKQKRKWWKRKVKESKKVDLDGEDPSNAVVMEDREDSGSESDNEGDGPEGATSDPNSPDETEDTHEEAEVGTASRDEADGNVQVKIVSRASCERTPGFSRSGGGEDQEGGDAFGKLEEKNQKHRSSKKFARGSDKDTSTHDLEMEYSDAWVALDQYTDCLDPIKHQGISILFSNTCHEGPKQLRPCLSPCVIPMFYYGQNDIAVGDFLQRYCFKDYYRCPMCNLDMAKHVRHIVHGNRSIHIEIRTTGNGSPTNNENIYTWLECLKCSHATIFTEMSANSLIFSFAKFLELKFYSDSYMTRSVHCSCTHSLHQDYSHYFKYKSKLVVFRPSLVDILEVLLPPTEVVISTPSNKYLLDYASEIKHIGRIVEGVFCRIRQKLDKYRLEPVAALINDHICNSRGERDAMRTKVKHLKELMVQEGFVETKIKVGGVSSMLSSVVMEDNMTSIQDCLADLKRSITEVVECWNILLEELDVRVREYRRRMREGAVAGDVAVVSDNRSPRESPVAVLPVTSQATAIIPENPSPVEVRGNSLSDSTTTSSSAMPSPRAAATLNQSPRISNKRHPPSNETTPLNEITILMSRKLTHERNLSDGGMAKNRASCKRLGIEEEGGKTHRRNLSDSNTMSDQLNVFHEDFTLSQSSSGHVPSTETLLTPDSVSPSHKVESEYVEVGEEPGPEEEGRNSMRYRDLKRHDRLPNGDLPNTEQSSAVATTDDVIHLNGDPTFMDTSTGFLSKFRPKEQEWRDDPTKYYLLDPSLISGGGQSSPSLSAASGGFSGSGSAKATPSYTGSEPQGGVSKGPSLKKRKSVVNMGASATDGDPSKGEKKSSRDKERLNILSRPFQRLPPPLEFNEHHTMPSQTDFPIAVYEKEPTSIIAYALSMRHYTAELKILRERKTATSAVVVHGLPETRSAGSYHSPKIKRNFPEADRPQTVTSAAMTSNGGAVGGSNSSKGFFRDLKKRNNSSTTLFSGSNHGNEMVDPFEQSGDVSPRKMETTSSSSGHSSRSGDLGSEVISSSATAASGLPTAAATGGGGSVASGGTEEDGGKSRGHISLEFSNPDKTSNFFCKVYFAEEFHQLREKIFPTGESKFIRSLTRCVKFEAKGGKSRSAFCKVADDRFILKQVKSIEISAFEEFAPRYLDYINKALEEKRPLALAKIFGAYSIGYKNSKTGSSKRMDVIVMENLLYGHSIARVFDLKGSMRSRYVDPSKDSSSDVLLDENYLNTICHAPVYVHPHSKFVLMQALMADSEFLAHNSIMDYSLLTCIDDNTGLLVVGIIDYVRTFTFDKRLEMYLKKTSGRELPTVVYPELYRKRFCEAMERYFTVVPDKWSGLGTDF